MDDFLSPVVLCDDDDFEDDLLSPDEDFGLFSVEEDDDPFLFSVFLFSAFLFSDFLISDEEDDDPFLFSDFLSLGVFGFEPRRFSLFSLRLLLLSLLFSFLRFLSFCFEDDDLLLDLGDGTGFSERGTINFPVSEMVDVFSKCSL